MQKWSKWVKKWALFDPFLDPFLTTFLTHFMVKTRGKLARSGSRNGSKKGHFLTTFLDPFGPLLDPFGPPAEDHVYGWPGGSKWGPCTPPRRVQYPPKGGISTSGGWSRRVSGQAEGLAKSQKCWSQRDVGRCCGVHAAPYRHGVYTVPVPMNTWQRHAPSTAPCMHIFSGFRGVFTDFSGF